MSFILTNNFDVLPTEIKLNNNLQKDPKNIANEFNNYFVNMGPNLASKISLTAQSSYMKYLYEKHDQAMFIVPVDEHEISLITSELKSNARSGHDELSADVLMSTMNYLLTPLLHIINTSIIRYDIF